MNRKVSLFFGFIFSVIGIGGIIRCSSSDSDIGIIVSGVVLFVSFLLFLHGLVAED
ncbi:MAG: hypothetical protein M1165_02815 [Candidatus Pacearchaeota archaeon]|nr:hypothetical protein [Candidatus Pacearchaeota archaeon]MDE1849046.1 hypothetical protein [Nanoarchaeota archaeon]